jgi:Tfp pilus assembly protein PilF
VNLPFLILLADYTLPDPSARRRVEIRPYIGYAAMLAVYALLRTKAGGIFGLYQTPSWYNSLVTLSAPLRVANAIRLAWLMLRLHFFPWPLSADYSPNAIPIIRDWLVLGSWMAASTALFAVWAMGARRSSAVLLAGSIYIAGFATTSNILYAVGNSFGERWAYFPSIGFCLLVGLGYDWLELRVESRGRMAALAALGVVTAAAAIATMVRNTDWKNDWAVVHATVRAYPECGRAQCYLGSELLKRGDLRSAEMHLKKAQRILPDYPPVHLALGSLAFRQGDWPAAEREMQLAMRYSDCEPDTTITYAALLLQSGHYSQALAMLNHLSVDQPQNSRVFSNRAVLYYVQKRPDLARADAEIAVRLNPANAQAAAILGRLQPPAR